MAGNNFNARSMGSALNPNFMAPVYNAVVHTCQHYFAEVLQQAQKYETKEKPLVLP